MKRVPQFQNTHALGRLRGLRAPRARAGGGGVGLHKGGSAARPRPGPLHVGTRWERRALALSGTVEICCWHLAKTLRPCTKAPKHEHSLLIWVCPTWDPPCRAMPHRAFEDDEGGEAGKYKNATKGKKMWKDPRTILHMLFVEYVFLPSPYRARGGGGGGGGGGGAHPGGALGAVGTKKTHVRARFF